MKLNKKRLGVTLGLLLVLILVVTFTFKKSTATTKSNVLKDQKIDGINFESAEIKKDKDGYTFIFDMYNDNTETIDIESIVIVFKTDTNDIRIKLDDINTLEPFEGRKMEIKVTDNLENVNGLEYELNKK